MCSKNVRMRSNEVKGVDAEGGEKNLNVVGNFLGSG
jgi:hypothetical protein